MSIHKIIWIDNFFGENIKFIAIFIFVSTTLFAVDTRVLIYTEIKERKFSLNGLSYIVEAKKKTIDYNKLRKLKFFKRKQIVSQTIFYNNGTFYQKNIKVDFVKGFFYDGNFYMQGCFSLINGGHIKADSAIVRKDHIEFKDLFIVKNTKKYRKFKHLIDTK